MACQCGYRPIDLFHCCVVPCCTGKPHQYADKTRHFEVGSNTPASSSAATAINSSTRLQDMLIVLEDHLKVYDDATVAVSLRKAHLLGSFTTCCQQHYSTGACVVEKSRCNSRCAFLRCLAVEPITGKKNPAQGEMLERFTKTTCTCRVRVPSRYQGGDC